MIRTLIVEDQKMIRGLLEIYVKSDSDYLYVASLANARYAVDYCLKNQIDLVLMDVMTENGESGLEATREIKARLPQLKVVVITSLLDEIVLNKAKEVGADSLWYKDVSQEELMDVVRKTMEGRQIFPDIPPEVKVGLASSVEFTRKEKEVLHYLVRGMSYPEIAGDMDTSTEAVRYHVKNMLQKTGCKDKLELAIAVVEAKIIVNDV